jgi:hypothetical protein
MLCDDSRDPFHTSQALIFYHHALMAVIDFNKEKKKPLSGLLEDVSFSMHHMWLLCTCNGAPNHGIIKYFNYSYIRFEVFIFLK